MKIGNIERLPYPLRMVVDIHSYCNAACVICPHKTLSKTLPMGHMTWDLYTKIIDDYCHLSKEFEFKGTITYCDMGEPFIEKNIAQWVKYAIDRNINVYFNTNAELLTPDVVDSLLNVGFKGSFNISCHGITQDYFEYVTGGLDLEKVLENVDYLLERYPAKNVGVTAVPYNWPKGEKNKLITYWRMKGVSVGITVPSSRAGLVPIFKKEKKKKIAGCLAERILYQMVIAFNGDVVLCCHDMGREIIVGNLAQESILDVWNGEKFRTILKMIYSRKKLPLSFICNRCEESLDYWSWRRIVKDCLPSFILNQIRKRRKHGWDIEN